MADGRTLAEVRDAAGHANVSITSAYLHVAVEEGVLVVIEQWLDKRSVLGIDARRRILSTLKGEPLQTAYVGARLPRLASISKR